MALPEQGDMSQTVDLTNCDREPIHTLGRVQAYGCLLAVSSDWMIAHASTNTQDILGLDADQMIGARFVDFFPEKAVHDLRTRIQVLAFEDGAARSFGFDIFGDGRLYDISIHTSDRFMVFEFEKSAEISRRRDNAASPQALILRVQRHDTLEPMLKSAARAMKALTGFDRVMVYRFEEDDTGTVIAEAVEHGMEPFLGLRYPASDIPKQARALYVRSPLRLIADVNGETFKIEPEFSADGEPLDLSLAVTRAVSPIHLEYLRNMGVGASMSASILRRGKLWGLFACHHNSARELSYEKRSEVELFTQLFNYELARLETDDELANVDRAQQMHDRLISQVSDGTSLVDMFDMVSSEIESVISFDGIAIYSNGYYRASGAAPTEDEFLGLSRFLNTSQPGQIFKTNQLGARYKHADGIADRVAGLLAIPISRTPRDYLVLFRREVASSVKWAGNPEKPVTVGPLGSRLTPRKSFEVWNEVVRGTSSAWAKRETRAADALRVTLLEVVLKLSDEANATRKRAQEQQELLIAELNHRVRNILNLIRGLVSQGRGDAETLDQYAAVLDERIHSLARAHDQLTQQEWGWVSLRTLIENEVDAFLTQKSARVEIEGDEVELSPAAFTSLALVMHELVTNSAKYGALNDSTGSVAITVTHDTDDDQLRIGWREAGGPTVKPPTRKGFGTVIIERSVPYELNGTAETRFEPDGFQADFTIPGSFVRAGTKPSEPKTKKNKEPVDGLQLSGDVLVLEDNMIIALDASDMLQTLGAKHVHTVSRVSEALRILGKEDISFALLDVNLGTEISLPVAVECHKRGIPAVLASGYGEVGSTLKDYPRMQLLNKPYTLDDLRALKIDQ